MHQPQGAYVAGNPAANRDPPADGSADVPTPLVVAYGRADAVWRREVAAALRQAGVGVRVASGVAEMRKALADGRVTHLVTDASAGGAALETSREALAWPPDRPMVRRLPGEPGAGTVARLLEGLSAQGKTSA